MKLYRYERDSGYQYLSKLKLNLWEYEIITETPKGYWVQEWGVKHWVSKTGKKRYAYPTPEEALVNFIARTKHCIKILNARRKTAEDHLFVAEKITEHQITRRNFYN